MGYCTADDIRADFKGVKFLPYDSTPGAQNTATTEEQLEEWIEQESALMDGYIGKIYILPITLASYPSAALVLKRICIFRVSARVKNKNEVKAESNQLNSDEKFLDNRIRTPNNDLMAIGKKELLLLDVPLIDSAGGFESFTSSSDSHGRKFNTNKQQW